MVVAEGEDEKGLVGALVRHLSLPECDIFNVEGSGNLKDRTAAATKIPGPPMQAIAIVRDAESDAASAAASARDILRSTGFLAPDTPFRVADTDGKKCG